MEETVSFLVIALKKTTAILLMEVANVNQATMVLIVKRNVLKTLMVKTVFLSVTATSLWSVTMYQENVFARKAGKEFNVLHLVKMEPLGEIVVKSIFYTYFF